MSYDPPLKIFITVPGHMPIMRGAFSTAHRGGNYRIRCTDKEYDIIKEESAHLNISMANFGRWCAVRVAEALRTHRLSESTDEVVGEDDDGDGV